jgi:hypothetical protein
VSPMRPQEKSLGPCLMPILYSLRDKQERCMVHCTEKQATGMCIALVVDWFSKKQVNSLSSLLMHGMGGGGVGQYGSEALPVSGSRPEFFIICSVLRRVIFLHIAQATESTNIVVQ